MTWDLDFDDGVPKQVQLGLFDRVNSCSRCGHTEWGAYVMAYVGNDPRYVAPGIPVTWRCVVCNGLVCGDCVLCKPASENAAASLHPMFSKEIWEVTYCSVECRALNIMSYTLGQPIYLDSDAQAELHQCPECYVWMHVSAGRCCSTLCHDVQYVRGEILCWR